MSTAAFVVVAIALALVAASVTAVALAVSRLLTRRDSAGLSMEPDVEPALDLLTDETSLVIPQLMFAPEYLDADALEALAVELGIDVDPVQTQILTGQEQSVQVSSSIAAHLTIPGVEVAATTSAAETNAELSQQATTTTRRPGFTGIVTEVTRRLAELSRLRIDLTEIPAASAELAAFAKGLIIVYQRWQLRDVPPTPPPPPPPSAGQVLATALAATPAPAPPNPTRDQVLRDSADVLWRRALDEIVVAKQHELMGIATSGGVNYALAVSIWRVAADSDGTNLRLYNHNLDPATEDQSVLTARSVVEVPLNPDRLTDPGKQRLRPGETLPLVVFGRIGAFTLATGTLFVHPVAVFSG